MPSTNNVTAAKPKVSGAIYVAPKGTTLPTDASTALDKAFLELGYVSEDGVENENKPSTDNIKDWSGSTIALLNKEKEDTWAFTLCEALNVNVLKTVFGSANVSGTLDTGITVKANNADQEHNVYVIDMILSDDYLKRIVVPNGVISSLEKISYQASKLITYGITVTAMQGDDGDNHKEYIAKKATA